MSLDQNTAIRRAKLIRQGSIQYMFQIILQPSIYYGLAEILFYYQVIPKEDLVIDFSGNEVQALIINGLQLDFDDAKRKNFIVLPKACLQKGKNRVSVLYNCKYNKDYSGLTSFIDNGEQFLYTQFEPYGANRVFPCFDQPDLKAYINLTVVGTQKWRILSHDNPIATETFQAQTYLQNSKLRHNESLKLLNPFLKKAKNALNSKVTIFPTTKLMPTYIFCFCAGSFKQISTDKGSVPMSFFCIPAAYQTLKNFTDLFFSVTIKCMDFYAEKFDTPYPFSKYDQILIRQFGWFAMENPGIVKFNERRLIRQNPTQQDLYQSCLVISHELSHHWFGDYVTMVWWDDLWLNQSFAEWISCYSLEYLKNDLKFQALSYFRDAKNQGYRDDERNNATHPIRGTVANTDQASSIFDGITYEKGASVLKQLMFLVGDQKFFLALQSYFRRFEWGNATIDDLLVDVSKHFPQGAGDLQVWKNAWLEKASLNIFDINWDQEGNKITLNQNSFDDKQVLRVHKLKISLFNSDGSFIVIPQDIFINSASQDIKYKPGDYSAVLVNHQDWTFCQNILDSISLEFFRKNIDKISDLLTRLIIWYNFRSMVNLSKITISEYIGLIKQKLFIDSSTFILQRILQNLLFFLSDFIEEGLGNAYRSSIFNIIYQQLQIADNTQTQRIQILQDNYISYASTQNQIKCLWKWLQGKDPLLNRKMNVDQKWKTVVKIYTLNIDISQKKNLFDQVQKQDSLETRIQDYRIILRVLDANEQQFQAVYQEFKKSDLSISVKYLKAQGWRNDYHYNWIANNYQSKYFDDIVELSQTLSYHQFYLFYTELKPIDYDFQTQINQYNQAITKLQNIEGMKQHIRNLNKIVDDLNLRIKNVVFNADTNLALSQARATHRYSYIEPSSIKYTFHIAFVKEEQFYQGMAEISFELNRVPFMLPVDCLCNTIQSVSVNLAEVSRIIDGEFLFVPQKYLKLGRNVITIRYKNKYNNDGLGCMSYIQTVGDPFQYLYTKFQPYGAHRFTPCFDQPDLKASAQFNIIVPQGWLALGNQSANYNGNFSIPQYKKRIPSVDPNMLDKYLSDKTGNFNQLNPTAKLPTYLYCIGAGQYYSYKVDSSKLHRNIPMTLYCIKSYSNRLERMADFIIQMTTKSLAFFQQKFGVLYQFSKYDSLFCHQFKSGAMQNPGLITFRDQYLFPEDVSLEKMLGVAGTIIHENVHNWFGNFVTMKWWNDLWLNESFADFISYYALEKLKDQFSTIQTYDSGWKLFLVRGVPGYRQDQITETTHAVRSVVENTSVAQTYFDRITYQKGSATLKQLMFLMSEDNFFKGVQDYFNEFGWKNATIDDFLNKMQKYFTISDFTLGDWKNSWLLTPSLNTVSIEWDNNDLSDSATLTIHQNYYSDVYPTLRYHKTRIAFFKSDGTYDVRDILLSPTPITTLTYNGSNNYEAVLVNYDYWDYFKYTIDDVSLAFFEENLDKISKNSNDVLTRMIIWHDINEQVRDASYKVADFIDIFRKFIFDQPDDKIFEFQFAFARDALSAYLSIPMRSPLKSQIFADIYNKLLSLPPPKNDLNNRIILLKDQLPIFAASIQDIKLLGAWREGTVLQGFDITVSQAWESVKLFFTLQEYSLAIKYQTYADQYHTTPGIQGQLVKNTCDALVADSDKMQQIFSWFEEEDLSLDVKESYISGWNSLVHSKVLQDTYKSRYFSDLPVLSRKLISNHFEFFYLNLKPIDDDLAETIAYYEKIKLQGGQMIGHMKVIIQIKYGYQLRQKLYNYNE